MATSGVTASPYVPGYQKHRGEQLLLVGLFVWPHGAQHAELPPPPPPAPDQGCSWRLLQ